MRSSLRNRLLALFLVLVVVVGALTLFGIEHSLADDLVSSLDARLTRQGRAVATWLETEPATAGLASRLAAVTGTRVTIVGADGLVQGDSREPAEVGRAIGVAREVERARQGEVGRAVRELPPDDEKQYLIAVPGDHGRVIRLAVPLGEIIETRGRMRDRLMIGFGAGFLGAIVLSWLVIRAITKPILAMRRTAEQLARGNYDVAKPVEATQAGGELGVLARAMMHMAGEVKARIHELTQQRDLLRVMFAELVEGVVLVDEHGAIVLANDVARPLVGGGPRLPPALHALVDRALRPESSVLGPEADVEEELELESRIVRASARRLEARTSDAAAAILVLYDVTRIRALESVRRDFLSNAAHELRTPVTSISGYAETLLGGDVDAETSKEFLGTIHRNAQRIAGLVSDLLVLDQLGARAASIAERVAVPVAQVVEDAVRTTKGVSPGAQLEVDVATDVAVLATRDGLDHVVQNLIDNAVKYGGGTVVRVQASRLDRRVRITVSDRGPGIPAGQEERVFERFFRVDSGRSRDSGGSGLGLAIVKSQVDAMGGRVWVEHADPGARFVVELDAA